MDEELEAKKRMLKGLIQRSKAEQARHQGERRSLDRMHAFWQLQMDLLTRDEKITSETIKGLQADLSEMDSPTPASSEPTTTSPTEAPKTIDPSATNDWTPVARAVQTDSATGGTNECTQEAGQS